MEKKQTLNQHSALTTFKIKEGNYYKVGVEKSIFALLARAQKDMRNEFKNIYTTIYMEVGLKKDDIKFLMDNTFKNKDLMIQENKINEEKLKEISKDIINHKKAEIDKQTSNKNEAEKLFSEIKNTSLFKLANKKQQLTIPENEMENILNEIKEYCKDLTIEKYLDAKTIDFTMLANKLNANTTLLKKEIKNAVGTVLEFNYINKKKIDIDVTSSMLSSVRFTHDRKNNLTWMTYQIPKEVLQLLLMPKIYVPLEGLAISKISGAYTYRMYSFFKDHINIGWVELTKEEVFNFFNLPKSYKNKTNLVKKFLIPTLKEVELVSGISCKYTFKPKNNWREIRFDLTVKSKIKDEEINIITKEEKGAIWKNEVILNELEKTKRNIYVSSAWNKRADNKILKIYNEEGEKYSVYILRSLYNNLKNPIKTTLVQYINGIIKNIDKKEIEKIKLNKVVNTKNNIEDAVIIEDAKPKTDMNELLYNIYLKMNDEDRLIIEEQAKKNYLKEVKLKELNGIQNKTFELAKKNFILKIIKNKFNS